MNTPPAQRDRPAIPPMHVRLEAVAKRDWQRWSPPTPRRAATVVLLRDSPDAAGPHSSTLQVYLMRRASSMAAAPDMHVFPGGGIADQDGPADDPASLVRAAVRELHEETGVLVHDPQRLVPFARWVTPEVLPHRHDTEFFGLAIQSSEQPQLIGTEAVADIWLSPQEALQLAAAHAMGMLPPTSAALEILSRAHDVPHALAILRARTAHIRALMPAPTIVAGTVQWYLSDALADGTPVTPAEAGLPEGWRPNVPVVSTELPATDVPR